ncbi:MAG: hypothetical protein E7513_05840 [Ruminococcaceae bacterium]|nr:hypothetical protein [Oscillospiraceae bacterium]
MKKLLILSLVLSLLLTVVGCATLAPNSVNVTAPTEEAVAVDPATQAVAEEQTTAQAEAETVAETKAKTADEKISEEKAKEIALTHASLKESEVKALFVELDFDDGVLRYEVDFKHGGYEYDYDIDAKSGTILSYDKDYDD